EAVYNSLPEYSKNLLKETDSNVYFVSKKDATILSGAKVSDDAVAYYYGLTNDVYFNTTGSMNTLIDYSSVSSAFGDEIATKMITNSGINYILTHELAHHTALADRTRESEGSKQREFNKRIKEISVRSVTEGVDDNYSHRGFVSPYARTNNDEDFAETFAFYATYKEHIDKVIKDKNYNVFGFVLTEKFKFMKEDVWGEK
ncbi:MAG: hypothetical protein EOL97_16775, partial [Spirochaetia bacterium]|nr:hypothetical protein [Spirochaetia bacterium]